MALLREKERSFMEGMTTSGGGTPTPRQLLDEYLAYLSVKKGRARTPRHIRDVGRRVGRMLEGVSRLEELTPTAIEHRLYELKAELVPIAGELRTRAAQTVDYYRRDLGSLLRWAIRRRRVVVANPVEAVDRFEPEDPKTPTRALSRAEAELFFARVPAKRLPIYLLWATCGLRPLESRRLVWGHFVFAPVEGGPPYIQVLRSTSKNRRALRQPLHPDLVRMLEPTRGRADERVFKRVPQGSTFRSDLELAGLEPVRVTPEGRLTRTSLRKLFATELDRRGESEGLVQHLMRHSTPQLTRERYTFHDLTEKARAVSALSFLPDWRRPRESA